MMGRARLNMQLINSEKARHATFQKRKNGLKKKIYELKTLCDVDACLIIYGPKIDAHLSSDPEIWPPNHEEIVGLIDAYKKKSREDRMQRTVDLSHFFIDRNKKVEEAMMKLRTKNNEAKYPTWDDRYNELTVEDLNEFLSILDNKTEEVNARVELIKSNPRLGGTIDMMDLVNMESTPIHPHHPFEHQTLEFDGSGINFVYKPFGSQIYYDPTMVGMIDHNMFMINNNFQLPPPPMMYYGSNMQPFLSPFVQYPVMPSSSSSSSSSQVLHGGSRMDQYCYQVSHELHGGMKNQNGNLQF